MKKTRQIDIESIGNLYPFKSRFMRINGLRYHYLDEGEGDPIVMIHGNPTWSFYFRNLIRELSSRYRVVAVDHIGCGLSDKPGINRYDYRLKSRVDDLEALLAGLEINNKISLIVHDWGGMIGLAYALRNFDKIGRIVILNTAAFLPPGHKKLPLRLWLIRNIKLFSVIAVQGFNLFAYAALFMASVKGLSREVKKGLIAPYNCWGNRIATLKFVQDIPVCKDDPSYSLVKTVDKNLYKLGNIPMLICWGMHDFVFDVSYLAEWRHRFPDAEVHVFKDAGHYLLEDEPEKTGAIVQKFLKNNPL